MATYGDIKTRVASNLVRTDLGTEIGEAINDAIAPFDAHVFSQPITPQKLLRALGKVR